MKICQIIPDLPMGGAETMCVTLSIELKKLGHQVCVISLYDCDTILSRRLTDAGIQLQCMGKKPGLDPGCIPKLRKAIKIFAPDVIHTHIHALKYAYIAALGLGIPMLRTIHSIASQDAEADTAINRFLFARGGVIPIAISDAIKDTTAEYYHLNISSIPVILNGVDLSRCIPKENYTADGAIKLLHIGRFHEAKNHKDIIQAMTMLKKRGIPVTLDCYGDGELLEEIKNSVARLDLQNTVRLRGVSADVFPILHDADIFLLPSVWEGIPMTIIEAMGTGLPIIASNVGGIPDMIEHNVSGLLIAPEAQALADAVEALSKDTSLRAHLGKGALQAVHRFSAEEMAEGYLSLYHAACKKA